MPRHSCMVTARMLVLAAGAAGVAAQRVDAQTNWLSAVSGNFGDPARWTSGVPGTTTTANITVGGAPYTVTLNAPFTVGALSLGGPVPSADATLALNNRPLTIRGAYAQVGSMVVGGGQAGSFLSIGGASSFDSAVLLQSRVLTRGTLMFAGAGDNDICDTDMDHRGSAITWSGTGRLLINGNSGRLTNGFASTFTILNDRNIERTLGGSPRLVNNGRIVKTTGTGTTLLSDVALTNVGTIEVQSGTFQANTIAAATLSGTTLNTGTWRVLNGAALDLVGATISTNNASVTLSGAGATFAAINGLDTIGASGAFTIQSGRNFTSAGNLTNNGSLTVGAGTAFTIMPGSSLTNFAAGTLTGGAYTVQGTLSADFGATIDTLNARIALDGAASSIVDSAAGNQFALRALAAVGGAGELAIRNGRDFATTAPAFTVAPGGRLTVGAGTAMSLNTLSNVVGGTLTGGIYTIQGQLRAAGAADDITMLDADLTLDGAGARVAEGAGNSRLGALAGVQSGRTLTVRGGQQLVTTAPAFALSNGTLSVDTGSRFTANDFTNFDIPNQTFSGGSVIVRGTLQFDGAAFTRVPTGVLIQPGGRVVNENNIDAFSALALIQTDAQFSLDAGETRTLQGSLTVETGGTLAVGFQGGAGATLNIPGSLTQQGSTALGGGMLAVTGPYSLSGTTSGSGGISASGLAMSGSGQLAPGFSPGQFNITADVAIADTSGFTMELGAPDSIASRGVLNDFIDITGDVTHVGAGNLSGVLFYTFINAFEPEVGDQFVLAQASGVVTGQFAAVVPIDTGIVASAAWVGQDLVLTVTALPAPGAGVLLALLGAVAARRRRA